MSIYYVKTEDGKPQKVDTENLVKLYADGRWRGSRPVYFWMTKSKKRYFVENQTRWQGEHSTIEEISKDEMISRLTTAVHSGRAACGLEIMGAANSIEEVS